MQSLPVVTYIQQMNYAVAYEISTKDIRNLYVLVCFEEIIVALILLISTFERGLKHVANFMLCLQYAAQISRCKGSRLLSEASRF
ncbi:Intermediate conductance calcium-activated potassium channel protein [Dirofilaria immitis]